MNNVMEQGQNRYPLSKVINSAIVIFLMFGFGRLIPAFGGITQVGMNVMGYF